MTSKRPVNQGKEWAPAQVAQLKKLVKGNTPTPLIAYRVGRSVVAVKSKAQDLNISLKPTNKSPYNRQKQAGK